MKVVILSIILVILSLAGVYIFNNRTEAQIIDVRTAEEYSYGHLDGAVNIPLATIESGDFSKINKDANIKLYCRSGNRSSQAKLILEKAGYKNISDLGAMEDLVKNGALVCNSDAPDC